MGSKRKADMGKVAGMLVDALLKKIHQDGGGVAQAMLERRVARKTAVGAQMEKEKAARVKPDEALGVLSEQYIKAMKGGDKCVAMQALSVAVSINGIKDNEIIEACSEPVTFAPGDTVGIIQKGTATTQARSSRY